MQKTLSKNVEIKGIGLHSGCEVTMTIKPAPVNSGINFKRIDVNNCPDIKALYSNIVDTKNCSCLGNKEGHLISTIEHLMSSLAVLEIDNALIEINNQETPIMDGSAKLFFEALKDIELVEQNAPRQYLKVLKTIEFVDDKGNKVELSPCNHGLKINFEIDFPSKIVGHQEFHGEVTREIFEKFIAPARTFCEKQAVDYLKSIGLVKGGSLENAVVLDGDSIMNEGGFRVDNECVNHKVLDAIGDLYLSGYPIIGELSASKTGHFHTNELLKVLFADSSNYEII